MKDSGPTAEPWAFVFANGIEMAKNLTRATAAGFFWLMLQSLASKFSTTIGQIVLSYLLEREHFGVMAMAFTVTAFTGTLQKAGIYEVVQLRQKKLELWATPAFWLSVAIGVACMLGIIAVSPLAAKFYDEPILMPVLWVLALAAPLSSASVVPNAIMNIRLRFKHSATLVSIQIFLQTLLTIILAWLGFGVWSLAIPYTAGVAFYLIVVWILCRPPIRLRPRFRKWKFILSDSSVFLGSQLLFVLAAQGDLIILGQYTTASIVGLYWMAFSFAKQGMTLFGWHMSRILFTILNKIRDEPARRAAAFMRTVNTFSLVFAPMSVAVVLLADPLTSLLYDFKFRHMAPLIQILALGTCVQLITTLSGSYLSATGAFSLRLKMAIAYVLIFFPIVFAGTLLGGAEGTAISVAIVYAIYGPLQVWTVFRRDGGRLSDVYGPFAAIYALALTAAIGAVFLEILVFQTPPSDLVSVIFRGGCYVPLLAMLMFLFRRRDLLGARQEFKRILGKGTSKSETSETAAAAKV